MLREATSKQEAGGGTPSHKRSEEAHQGRGAVSLQGVRGWRYDAKVLIDCTIHCTIHCTHYTLYYTLYYAKAHELVAGQAVTTATVEAVAPRGADGTGPSWAEIVGTAYGQGVDLLAEASFTGGDGTGGKDLVGLGGNHREHPKDYYNFGASVTEVEVDVLTGEVQVLRTGKRGEGSASIWE
jgi:hypothetical protein